MTVDEEIAEFNPKVFRHRLHTKMLELNLKQIELAALIKSPRDTLSRIITGRVKRPRAMTIKKLADQLGVEYNWLIGADVPIQQTETEKKSAKVLSFPSPAMHLPAESASGKPAVESVPIVGTLEDGVFRAIAPITDASTLRQITAARHPRFQNFRHFAFEVADSSMELAGIARGDLVICVDFGAIDVTLQSGMIVVTEQAIGDGSLKERTIKQVNKFPDQLLLEPRSNSPGHKPIAFRNRVSEEPAGVRIVALAVAAVKNLFT